MKDQPSGKDYKISRRGMLPLLGSGFLIPFLGFGKTNIVETSTAEEDEYQTLLKPDGTAVKVKVSTLKKSKVVKKNLSNSSLLQWLNKK
ncbi:hypothetical protein GCM10007962_15800 [Yeosuana aromativorans]|uniref:Uncharacterized protein n=1 Tax=Yeosuana aromativorans TaxID=288019 RepID=A0A8J3BHY6_9FLAO|nr:hypothetical protein [Yeosuana aromativorans]GGK22464.1 hypothetical protein GCM10007962_15800 [Yeosuana aromativorans]